MRTMSEQDLELVRNAIHALNERDSEAMRTLFNADFEYHGLTEWPGLPRVTRGLDEYERRQVREDAELARFRLETLELIDAGERVVMVFQVSATGRQSGVPISFTEAAVISIRDGRVARIEICGTREKALEAVGLSG
jgi:ketosteroid isomerase-like protein